TTQIPGSLTARGSVPVGSRSTVREHRHTHRRYVTARDLANPEQDPAALEGRSYLQLRPQPLSQRRVERDVVGQTRQLEPVVEAKIGNRRGRAQRELHQLVP